MGWYSKEGEKNAKKHHKAEIERQKIENERIKTQLIAFRLMKTCINSSPDAMRELAGLKSLEIKEASTYNELILGYII